MQSLRLSELVEQQIDIDSQLMSCEIVELSVERATHRARLTVFSNSLISMAAVVKASARLSAALSLNGLSLRLRYPVELLNSDFLPQLGNELVRCGLPTAGFFSNARLEYSDNTVRLYTSAPDFLKSCGVDEAVKRIIFEIFKISVRVELAQLAENSPEIRPVFSLAGRSVPTDAQPQSTAPARVAEPAPKKPEPKPKITAKGELLFGRREPTGGIVGIAELDEASGKVCVCGEIFEISSVQTRDRQRNIFSIKITDYKGSIGVKLFVDAARSEPIESLRCEDSIVAEGSVVFDTYDKHLIIRATSLLRIPRPQLVDTADKKRVELHCHTNMSVMDAVAPVEKLMNLAAELGHPAIAITDHGVVQAFPYAMYELERIQKKYPDFRVIYGMEGYLIDDTKPDFEGYKRTRYSHIIMLVKNSVGLKNLYKLVSLSHLEHFHRRPLVLRSEVVAHREGLILGSACEAGEVFRAVRKGLPFDELCRIADFYDYLEIQPIANNYYLVRNGLVPDEEGLRELNRTVLKLADKLRKPCVATGDVHFLGKNDAVYRSVLQAMSGYADIDKQPPLYLRTTDNMLEEFSYLGEGTAYEVVVENTRRILEQCDPEVRPIPKGIYNPHIEGADEELRTLTRARALELYGKDDGTGTRVVPELVTQRLEKELGSIISNGYAVLYIIAQKLVSKSVRDGYSVGSRGSVGSSFVATMAGISEVNPLPPHYRCPKCCYSQFFTRGEYGSGFDLPDMDCPDCGTRLCCDGHEIPFETFLGFNGDKAPDIDLNFSGEYQSRAHRYTEELFGKDKVFKAGTISTLADKTAYMYARKYEELMGIAQGVDTTRLAAGCTGVKKTTGQHPGGMVIIPEGYDVYDFCPVQRPANDQNSESITTHFEFKSMHDTILKLDELGHDVPTILKYLEDYTGVKIDDIPMNDRRVYELFTSSEPLGVDLSDIDVKTGTLAIPEMGTRFVREMLMDAQPKTFSDLLQISGLSHGTDVWLGNAKSLIDAGTCTISEVIGTRDSIMTTLMHYGLPASDAFNIMEITRKGQAAAKLTDEMKTKMRENGVPEWYIDSCIKIKYMFPKAHAAAYVISAIRLSWFKLYYPKEFYAVQFSIRGEDFDADLAVAGAAAVRARLKALSSASDRTDKEDGTMGTLQIIYEMLLRGVKVLPVDINVSKAKRFTIEGDALRLPFTSIAGIGEAMAEQLEQAQSGGRYISVNGFMERSGAGKSVVEKLKASSNLAELPESDQITLFA